MPEDVAVLYTWANLLGAKYRDFSASRREYRAQIRYRAAKALYDRELQAQADAEAAAEVADRAAAAAEAVAQGQNSGDSQALRLQALRSAEAAARKAAMERTEAARRGESAARAALVAQREEREIAEARLSSDRQASNYAESETRRRDLAGPQPRGVTVGETADPYTTPTHEQNAVVVEEEAEDADREFLTPGRFGRSSDFSGYTGTTLGLSGLAGYGTSTRHPDGDGQEDSSATPDGSSVDRTGGESGARAAHDATPAEELPISFNHETGFELEREREGMGRALDRAASQADPDWTRMEEDRAGPAWLYSVPPPPRARVAQAISQSCGSDTLQDSRERVAARWFALKGVFEDAGPGLPAMRSVVADQAGLPLLLVFSLAGGVGKTSLVATVGRALSAQGERVVLTDTTSHGLLPFYFGARDLKPGVVRTFSPPEESRNAPIYLVSYEVDRQGSSAAAEEALTEEILQNGQGNQRMLVDLGAGSSWLIRRIAQLHPTVLVPVSADMNSVIGMQAVEKFFQGIADSDGRALRPYYVLNQFDATLPLHLDVREVFRRQLGERLLNFVIRRSQAVSEALAEGMTVIDYAPDSPVARDYQDIATWLRKVSPAAQVGVRQTRWSEQ